MFKKTILILILAIMLSTSYANRRRAMLVGVQNYREFASLEGCHGDVDAMRQLLMQAGFEDDHIWSIKDAGFGEMLTASDIYTRVNAFTRTIESGDEVLFFFSGHGIGGADGRNFLLGADGNIENPERFGLSVEEIKQKIKEKSPSEAVLIVDACRNFVKKEGRGAGEMIASKMNIGKGLQVLPKLSDDITDTRKPGQPVIKTIYAASEGQQSFERRDKGKGAFTYYLTYLLDSPNSAQDIDMSGDGVITIEDMVQFADNRLNDWTSSQGLPAMNPVYQTEGAVSYSPFMLFRYDTGRMGAGKDKKPDSYSHLNIELPVYQPDAGLKATRSDLSRWEIDLFNDKLQTVMGKIEKTDDLFEKHRILEDLRTETNQFRHPEVKQRTLVQLEPIYQQIDEVKQKREADLDIMRNEFEKDIDDMERMVSSQLSDELKEKYLAEFREKWEVNSEIQTDRALFRRFRIITTGTDEHKSETIGMEMIFVHGGTFSREGNRVTVGDFYIGKYEVTQAQYQAVMGKNPSHFKGDNLPVESVTWHDAVEFCKKLSQKEGITYRLPTEAEWEYAARGGNKSRGFEYSGSNNIDEVAWYHGNSGGVFSRKTHHVGAKQPNELGIYDMSGNVWEWCSDWYGPYSSGSQDNPTGPSSGSSRVLRGGSWYYYASYCRVASRNRNTPGRSYYDYFCGFRVVRTP